MGVWLLGPLRVDGVERLAPRDRVLLTVLALHAGHVVAAERLADALWGDAVPESWAKVVQGSVVRLRKQLGRSAVETTSGGYRLALADDEVDLRRFERLVERGRELARQGEHERAALVLADAVALWRGPALADVEHWPAGRAELTRLEERRRDAEELLVEARLAAGHDTVGAARALADAEPLRERRWQLLATALYRDGRQAEALAALRSARTALREELGLDPGPELVALERAVLQHDPGLAAQRVPASSSTQCPYRGLRAFDREDADRFFGRSEEVQACLRVLRDSPVLAVVGPSGSGKSSLVRAGLVPALEAPGHRIPVVLPGTDPIAALVAAACEAGRAPVIVVDQLEELFTAGHDPDVVRGFLERLAALAASGDRVVVVLRADRVGGLATAPAFARLAEKGLLLLTAMSEPSLRAAVLGPARQAGLRLEPGLVELLLRDVEDGAGALPLLSHALAETWERREADLLTVEAYRATGGIRHAVAQSAELLHEQLEPGERQVLRSLLLRLVIPSPDGAPAAVRVPVTALTGDPDRRRVLDLLVRARLVTTDDRTVVLAHEALITAWPRLAAWLDEDVAGARVARHLALAAEDWDTGGRADSDLYRGGRLDAAVELERTGALTELERSFLAASGRLAATERAAADERRRLDARHDRLLRRALAATAAGLVVALAAGAVAVERSVLAARSARAAQVDRLVAQSAALVPTRRDLAALLAVEAHSLRSDAATRSALLGVLTATPGFLGYAPSGVGDDAVPLADAELLSPGSLLGVGVDGVVRTVPLDGGSGARFPAPSRVAAGAVLDVSADGRTAAAVSWEGGSRGVGRGRLAVYDVPTRRLRLPETLVPFDVGSIAVSPDGARVAVAGHPDGRVVVFDVAGRAALPELASVDAPDVPAGVRVLPQQRQPPVPGDPRRTTAVAFDASGRLLVGSRAGGVRVVEPATGQVVDELTGAPDLTSDLALEVLAEGRVVVSAGSAALVRWDASAGRPVWTTPTGRDACRRIAVHELGGAVLCARASGTVTAFDLLTGRSMGSRYDLQRGPLSALAVTPDGRTLVQAGAVEPVTARWRLDGSGPVTTRLALPGAAGPFSPDGRRLLVDGGFDWRLGAADPAPGVVDVRSGAVVARLDGYHSATWWRSSAEVLAWSGTRPGHVVDLADGARSRHLPSGFGEPPAWFSAGADSSRMLFWGGGAYPSYAVWDVATGKPLWTARGIGLRGGALTPDGRTAVRLERDRVLSTDVDSGDLLAQGAPLRAVAISPTGEMVGATTDGRLVRYDPRTLAPQGTALDVTRGEVDELVFDGSGALLALRRPDGAVSLVDVATGTELGRPVPGAVEGGHLALSPDGRQLSVPVAGGTTIWALSPDTWVEAACRLAGRRLTPREREQHLDGAAQDDQPCAAVPAAS